MQQAARSIPTSRLILRSRETRTDIALIECTQAPQVNIQRTGHFSDQQPASVVILKAASTSGCVFPQPSQPSPALLVWGSCNTINIVVTVSCRHARYACKAFCALTLFASGTLACGTLACACRGCKGWPSAMACAQDLHRHQGRLSC